MEKEKFILFLLVLFLLNLNFGSCIEAEINCTDPVISNEDFNCIVKATNFSGVYDLKIDILVNNDRIASIWDQNKQSWRSTTYYIIGLIDGEEEKSVKLKITTDYEGEAKATLKLRKNSSIYSKDFILNVKNKPRQPITLDEDQTASENQTNDNEIQNLNDNSQQDSTNEEATNKGNISSDSPNQPASYQTKTKNIINLGPQEENKEIYVSKSEITTKYAMYIFALFLVFVIIILLRK
jgi:hypothetical protein